MKQVKATLLSKKIIAHEVVTIRNARGGDYKPLVIPLPRSIADEVNFDKGVKVHIYTDGEQVYIKKLEDLKM